ncbi:MAG: hypothetical protein Q8Q09_13275 [Deltaproteobacteria bacterium]|nr:hypothetical protein [Deltaproteobacteria bacterium]
MRHTLSCWGLALSLLLSASVAGAVPAAELAQRAQQASARGDHQAAARSLEELVAAGFDGNDVLYQLGTVYSLAGRYGEAIWRFEQVTRRSLLDGQAQHNLRATRLRMAHRDAERTGRAVAEAARPWRVVIAESAPLDVAVGTAIMAQLAMLAALWFARRRGESQRIAGISVAALSALATCAALAVVVCQGTVAHTGVVLRDGVRLLDHGADDALGTEALREGERVELLGEEATFVRVRASTGSQGWVRQRDVGAL